MPYKRLKMVKRRIDFLIGPLLRRLFVMGLRPVHLTVLSLPCGLLGVWFLFTKPFLSPFFVFSYLVLDVLDGTLARASGTVSETGNRLDFLVDKVVASFFLVMLYLWTGEVLLPAVGLSAVVLFTLEDFGLIKR
ncbi:MAG: CDP-alcohol phosphatidyltransferase family protein [Candidatus Altiarchaeota archaeon]